MSDTSRRSFLHLVAKLGLLLIACEFSPADASVCDQQARLSAADLRSKVFAVHATDYFPQNGIIDAGASDQPSFRPAIHFSLGELVRPHGRENTSTWDEKRLAIVLPLGALESDLVNINTYDTFIAGDLQIQDDATWVIQESDIPRLPPKSRYVLFGKKSGVTLRQAVDKAIADRNGFKFTMENTASGVAPAMFQGRNINTSDFFAPLLKANTKLSFGSHIYSEVGEAFRFGVMDQAMQALITAYFWGSGRTYMPEMKFHELMIRYNLKKLDTYYSKSRFSMYAMGTYRRKRQEVLNWLNLAETDSYIFKQYGVNILNLDESLLPKITQLKSDPGELRSFIENLVKTGVLRKAREVELGSASSVAFELASFPLEEAEELLAQSPDLLRTETQPEMWLRYAIVRLLQTNGKDTSLYAVIDKNAALAAQTKIYMPGYFINEMFRSSLSEDSPSLHLALAILSRESIRKFAQTALGLNLPNPVVLDDALKKTARSW